MGLVFLKFCFLMLLFGGGGVLGIGKDEMCERELGSL